MKSRELAIGGLLTAFALLIPLAFGGVLGITIPPFSATLASHVPVMMAMLISPMVAVMVGLGSGLGFLIRLGPVIGARAATHAVWGYLGALLIERKMAFPKVLGVLLPVHALLEVAVVMALAGLAFGQAMYITGLGTGLHHAMDSVIAVGLAVTLRGLFGDRVFRVRESSGKSRKAA